MPFNINASADYLIAVFFLVAGLELGYELRAGWLSSWRTASSAVLAAVAGMVTPALLYLNLQVSPTSAWVTAVATDLPIALIVFSLVGRNLRPQVRVFLLALAIVDDALSVVLMNFVAPAASSSHLTLIAICLGTLVGIASTALAKKLIRYLQPFSNLIAVPLFILISISNAIDLENLAPASGAIGLIFARILGKTLGISLAGWLALRFIAPRMRLSYLELLTVGAAGSIGLTVSLLFAQVGLNPSDFQPAVTNILLALTACTIWAIAVVAFVNRRSRESELRAQSHD